MKTKSLRWFGVPVIAWALASLFFVSASASTQPSDSQIPGATYTNYRDKGGPWSIHIVRVDRSKPEFEICSLHAEGHALGLDTLSGQLSEIKSTAGTPIAGVNGDFFQRDRTFAGDPRGLQIVDRELISAPTGGASFWIDTNGQPHIGRVASRFRIVATNGLLQPFGLNGQQNGRLLQLYTPMLGSSTHTTGGRELVLESGAEPWARFEIGQTYSARVREVFDDGDTPLKRGTVVLSIPPKLLQNFAAFETGATLVVSTKTSPDLSGARAAISGGPILIHEGRPLEIVPPEGDAFESRSMTERHPRSAIGWNAHEYFLVEVDGRQKGSVGMTLEELGSYLAKLGCQEAMNLDGGGSATLWFAGAIRNHPCDGHERPIANSLAIIRKGN